MRSIRRPLLLLACLALLAGCSRTTSTAPADDFAASVAVLRRHVDTLKGIGMSEAQAVFAAGKIKKEPWDGDSGTHGQMWTIEYPEYNVVVVFIDGKVFTAFMQLVAR